MYFSWFIMRMENNAVCSICILEKSMMADTFKSLEVGPLPNSIAEKIVER